MAVDAPPAPSSPPVDLTKGVFGEDPDDAPRLCQCGCGKPIPANRHPSAQYFDDDHKERAYRARARAASGRPAAAAAPATSKKSDDSFAVAAWAMLGYGVQLKLGEPLGWPVGQVMQYQAGDAGPRLERLSGKVTKALPFLNSIKSGSQLITDLGALLGPPLLTAAIASGTLPRAIAEPLFIGIMNPLIASALERGEAQAAAITEINESQAKVVNATRQLFDAMFGADPAADEQPPASDTAPAWGVNAA